MKIIKNQILQGKHQKPILVDVFYNENTLQKPVVIFCHGYKGFKDWGAWNLMAVTFAEAGFCFVKFNFSHNGGTVEQPIDFSDLEAFGNNNYTKELDDVATVIDWVTTNTELQKEVDSNNISLIGHSRGGGIVLLKAHEDTRIKKVITLAAVSNFGERTATIGNLETWKKDGVKYVLNGRTKQQMPHYYQFYEDFKKNENRLNIQKATENLTIPLLIIHGNRDAAVFLKEGEKLHQWNAKSQFKIIDGTNHVFGTSHPWKETTLSEALEKVTQLCVDFLK